jgi:chromate transport protein ChrA
MEQYLGIPLLVLLVLAFLLVARMQRHRWVKVTVALFAAATCSVFAYQLWENPAVAVLLAVLAVWFGIEALLGWLLERAWAGARSWWRRRGDTAAG